MQKLNYERSPTTEAKQIVRSIKYFVSTNHIAVTRKSKLKKKKNKAVVPSYSVALLLEDILNV